jgi:hypothetical protein
MDFDLSDIYFSRQQLQRDNNNNDEDHEDGDGNNSDGDPQEDDGVGLSGLQLEAARRHFREFLRECKL